MILRIIAISSAAYMKNRMLKIACQPEMSRWSGPGFAERPIFRRNPLDGFLKHGAQSSREKLHSKILFRIVFAVRVANLERAADGIFFASATVQMPHLQSQTRLFSSTCEALTGVFCV